MNCRKAICVALFMIFACGCNTNPRSTVWEGELSVFVLDEDETRIRGEGYTPKQTQTADIISELLVRMGKASDEKHVAAIPENVALPEVVVGTDGLVTLQFDESYGLVTGVREVLMRAAIVKTLCQVETVEFVEFYVAGQPLMGSHNTPIGIMKAADFIDNMGPQNGEYQYLHAKVYFADKAGNALLASDLKIPYKGTESGEQVVLRQLIAGPIEEEMYPVLSGKTEVLGVSTKDGVCTVNFSKHFLKSKRNVKEEIMVYSVVNTLAELQGVYQVQFLIEGERVKGFSDMDLTLMYERNLNVIEKE